MAYRVTVQDPSSGRRQRIEVQGATTAEAIVAAGQAAPGMRVLDVQRAGDTGAPVEHDDAMEMDPVFVPTDEEISEVAAAEAHISWRPARPSALPYVATLVVGIVIGGVTALGLTGGFAQLQESGLQTFTGASPAGEQADAADGVALEAVHATNASDLADAQPVDTQRIVNPTDAAGSIYRVITRDDATGYLYETLIRAETAAEAADRCAARTRMRIVEVQRVSPDAG
jgi:hypothetical protein